MHNFILIYYDTKNDQHEMINCAHAHYINGINVYRYITIVSTCVFIAMKEQDRMCFDNN